MLYACYDLIRLDLVMEMSWRHGLTDFTMVYSFHTYITSYLLIPLIAIYDQFRQPAGVSYRDLEEG